MRCAASWHGLVWSQGAADAQVQAILRAAELVDAQLVTSGSYELWLHDPKDHPIMATALIGGVDYLVTANTRDFPPKKRFAGITVRHTGRVSKHSRIGFLLSLCRGVV